jgi:hypothetical protein
MAVWRCLAVSDRSSEKFGMRFPVNSEKVKCIRKYNSSHGSGRTQKALLLD